MIESVVLVFPAFQMGSYSKLGGACDLFRDKWSVSHGHIWKNNQVLLGRHSSVVISPRHERVHQLGHVHETVADCRTLEGIIGITLINFSRSLPILIEKSIVISWISRFCVCHSRNQSIGYYPEVLVGEVSRFDTIDEQFGESGDVDACNQLFRCGSTLIKNLIRWLPRLAVNLKLYVPNLFFQ